MTRFFSTLLIGFFVSTTSLNVIATSLTITDNLIISEIDDKPVEQGFIGKKVAFELSPGEHSLIVRYKDVFEDLEFAEERVVESQDFVVKFTLDNEQQVKLSTSTIKNLQQAELFTKTPELNLTDDRNKQMVLTLLNVDDYKLAQRVNMAVSSFTDKKAAVSPQKNTVSVKNGAPIKASTIMRTSTSKLAIDVNNLTMLKYWWQTASAEEKSQFKAFLKNK